MLRLGARHLNDRNVLPLSASLDGWQKMPHSFLMAELPGIPWHSRYWKMVVIWKMEKKSQFPKGWVIWMSSGHALRRSVFKMCLNYYASILSFGLGFKKN